MVYHSLAATSVPDEHLPTSSNLPASDMFYDVLIIGAGPAGLAAAARLREKTPSALFTNEEHARYWKNHKIPTTLQKEQKRKSKQRKESVDSGYASTDENATRKQNQAEYPSMVVLDADNDQWLSRWKDNFASLQISHLRSPLFFHPDPQDRDGLLAYAHEQGRTAELIEITNVAGKEISKHERKCQCQGKHKQKRKVERHLKLDGRDQIDYFTPSTKLFEDYCSEVVRRYGLDGVVQKARVKDVVYDASPDGLDHGLFTVMTDTGLFLARVVVVATGPGNSGAPSIPRNFSPSTPGPVRSMHGLSHVFHCNGTRLPSHIEKKLAQGLSAEVIVVGGGLTSAQLTDLLLRRHKNLQVHLFLRRKKIQIKPFDVDIAWVSKTRNHKMATFWSADSDEERVDMLRMAKGGGSITPGYAKILKKWEGTGRLQIHCDTQIVLDDQCIYDTTRKAWMNLHISSSSPSAVLLQSNNIEIDHIFCATTSRPDITTVPFLQSMLTDSPIETLAGLPVLTDDLAWSPAVPLFFTGGLAGLRLGPGAANLAGARLGAERVAWAIEEALAVSTLGRGGEANGRSTAAHETVNMRTRSEFTGSSRNQFQALSLIDD